MTTLEPQLANLYAQQIGVTPRLEFSASQVQKILNVGRDKLREIKRTGHLRYYRRGSNHVFHVLDIYAYQNSQRDLDGFKRDQVAA